MPHEMAEKVQQILREEWRNMSEFLREAILYMACAPCPPRSAHRSAARNASSIAPRSTWGFGRLALI